MNSVIIRTFLMFALSSSLLLAEAVHEWREMSFGSSGVRYGFTITTAPVNWSESKGRYWNGTIKARYSLPRERINNVPDLFRYTGDCSLETYEYAYKLTNRDRAAEISKEDSLASVFPDKVKVHKYTFAVCNTPKSITETAYRGYLSEEEFVTLLSMILKDAERSASLKHSADPKTEELKALIAKKLKEISQKSAK